MCCKLVAEAINSFGDITASDPSSGVLVSVFAVPFELVSSHIPLK